MRVSIFILCPAIAFAAMLVLGADHVIERMQKWIAERRSRIIAAPAGLLLLYVIYATGMGSGGLSGIALMAVYLSVPFVVLGIWPKAEPVAILWIWLPLEFGVLRSLHVQYVFAQLLAIDAGIIAFAVWNRTPGIGYRFEWDRAKVRAGLMNFVLFAVIGIPLGFAIRFIHYSFEVRKLVTAAPLFLGIFLFTALPEEFLFRGLIQNWIERITRRPSVGLAIASVIFGASHLNNGLPAPNYRYFLMATIAGLFYGRSWRSTGSLMASSLTHALVDTVWSVVFR